MVSIKSIMRLVSIACLALLTTECSQSVSYAANVCDPVTGTNCVEVNAAANGGGAHVSEYDLRDQFTGQKRTYSAGTTTLTATAAGTNPFFSICGSASTVVRVQQFNVNGSVATTAVRRSIILQKTSTATSGGTATALTQVPRDSGSAAATVGLVNFYTVLATPGTLVGTVGTRVRVFPITATVAATDAIPELIWDFVGRESEAIVLRGTGECLEASFDTTTTTAPTLALSVTWTEE